MPSSKTGSEIPRPGTSLDMMGDSNLSRARRRDLILHEFNRFPASTSAVKENIEF